jgi:hypothetical protein
MQSPTLTLHAKTHCHGHSLDMQGRAHARAHARPAPCPPGHAPLPSPWVWPGRCCGVHEASATHEGVRHSQDPPRGLGRARPGRRVSVPRPRRSARPVPRRAGPNPERLQSLEHAARSHPGGFPSPNLRHPCTGDSATFRRPGLRLRRAGDEPSKTPVICGGGEGRGGPRDLRDGA